MASLGFRRPNFSEEAEWLPGWLQNSEATNFDNFTKEFEDRQVKLSEGKVDDGKDGDDGQYNNCCLFLSGADNSSYSLASPTASTQVLHLHLHISSDGNSQNTQSLLLDNYLAKAPEANAAQMQPDKCPFQARQTVNSGEILGTMSLLRGSASVPEAGPESPYSKGERHVKRSKDKTHKYDYFAHAVELSIAASEALLIHELLGNEEISASAASSLLEVSLKMKKARLQWVEKDSSPPDQLNISSEYLSDLDDSALVDDFADVGLCSTSSANCCINDSIMSHVKESPLVDLKADYKFRQSEVPNPEVSVDHTTGKFSEENWDINTNSVKALQHHLELEEIKFTDDDLVLKYDRAVQFGGLESCKPVLENAELSMKELQVGFNMHESEPHPPQRQLSANSTQSHNHDAPEGCQLNHLASGRFSRRWLGGWKSKDDCFNLKSDTKKHTAKDTAFEASSLSESVDVPDKSSYMDEQELKQPTAVQADTNVNGLTLTNMVDNELLISQDFAKHSSSLSIDPLCSAVPCSILSETLQSLQHGSLFPKDVEHVNHDPTPPSRNIPDNVNISDQMVKVKVLPTSNDKDSNFKVDKCINGNPISTFPDFMSTEVANPGWKGQPSVGDLTSNKTGYQEVCTKSTNSRSGFLTFQPKQGPPVFHIKGINRLQAASGLSGDKKLVCSGSHQVLDDFQLQEKTYVPQTEVTFAQDNFLPRKRVHFQEDEVELEHSKQLHFHNRQNGNEFAKKLRTCNLLPEREICSQEVKRQLTNYRPCYGDKLIFHGLEFLLTGFRRRKEKETEELIKKYGGVVLSDIPFPTLKGKRSIQSNCQKLPVVLCLKKVQTSKFLYGCAVNAYILKVDWLMDSVLAGSVLQPEKYMILLNLSDEKHTRTRMHHAHKLIFEGVGVMFQGKHGFCTKLSMIFKYGGGQVFKTLRGLIHCSERKQILIQAVVTEDKSLVSRHLKHYAIERNLPIVSASWIINSLHSGNLLDFTERDYNFPRPLRRTSSEMPLSLSLSQEI
uniref:BRCT domain-containing protein n=1 Tax=Kalanchoe fedtschenkoi TaxID=63787 RepID=A0A7N1A1D1_KALFE